MSVLSRVLVTAFEPFNGSAENASLAALTLLRDSAGDATRWATPVELRSAVLPVDTFLIEAALLSALDEHDPAVVVLLGESAKAEHVTIERLAVNLLDFTIPDNAGALPVDVPIDPGGPAALWSTLPVRACVHAVETAGGSAVLSLSAGAYLCNQAMYLALRWAGACSGASGAGPRVGFVHLPPLPSQVARGERSGAGVSADRSASAVRAIVSASVVPGASRGGGY